jgi:deazaflavin-dependent oxidoreductase (nitroreductase family)
MTIMAMAHSARAGSRLGFLRATKVFNKLVLPLAGTRVMPLYGILEHRGRRSGKTYRTPVVVRSTSAGFIVPMPWGLGTDWYRNVQAAGGCTIRWKGRTYQLGEPQVIDRAAAAAVFDRFQLRMMERFGIEYCLRLTERAN